MEKKEPITLGYWNIRGLAEPIRLLMEHLGVNYKEVLYERGPGPEFSRESWLKVKFTLGFDFPNLPYLIDGSFQLTESMAVIRYICHKFGSNLLGTTFEERAYVDMLSCVLYDLNGLKSDIVYALDPSEIPKTTFDNVDGTLQHLAKMLETKKFLAGDNLTYVDFIFAEMLEAINDLIDPVFKKYPSLQRYFIDFTSLPNIQKYRNSEKYLQHPKPYNDKIARLGATVLSK